MIMSFEGYQEALESQKQKEDELKTMKDQFNTMQAQMQSVISTLSGMNQTTKNTFAKQLFISGIYEKDANF
jgi:flagellar capping protein FliD